MKRLAGFALGCVLGLAQAAPPPSDAEQIRQLRLDYNKVIAQRDAAGMARFLQPGMAELVSTGELVKGSAAVVASYRAVEFKDADFLAYERMPESVEVARDGRSAVEHGHWRALFRKGQETVVRHQGAYQAGWVRTPEGWRIQTESYVRL